MNISKKQFDFQIFTSLIRALFPNWNFFDRIAYSFELQFQIESESEWQTISFSQKRKWYNLFFNPECNMALAQINIIEHFARDLQEVRLQFDSVLAEEKIQNLTTFRLLKSLLNNRPSPGQSLIFKIVAVQPSGSLDLYMSKKIPWDDLWSK